MTTMPTTMTATRTLGWSWMRIRRPQRPAASGPRPHPRHAPGLADSGIDPRGVGHACSPWSVGSCRWLSRNRRRSGWGRCCERPSVLLIGWVRLVSWRLHVGPSGSDPCSGLITSEKAVVGKSSQSVGEDLTATIAVPGDNRWKAPTSPTWCPSVASTGRPGPARRPPPRHNQPCTALRCRTPVWTLE